MIAPFDISMNALFFFHYFESKGDSNYSITFGPSKTTLGLMGGFQVFGVVMITWHDRHGECFGPIIEKTFSI